MTKLGFYKTKPQTEGDWGRIVVFRKVRGIVALKHAYIYARVSSKEQEREGYSIPAQLELLRKYADTHGFKVLKEFTEAETAKSAGREEFGHMVAAIKKQRLPVVILVEKTDRLYRNIKDFIVIDELMNNHSVEVHKVKEGKIVTNDIHSSEKFMELIKVGMAKQYIDNLSEEVKKGQLQKVKEGGWAWPAPYGYRNNRETRMIEPNPETSPYVTRAFELYSHGHSIQSVIETLYEEGYIYRPYAPKCGKTKLREILRSRVYAGEFDFKGEIYQLKHQPLVSKAVWHYVQTMLRKGNKPMEMTKQDFLFKGKLICGECGKPLVGEYKKKADKVYTYYRCSDMKRTCSQGYIGEQKLEQAFSDAIGALLFHPDHKQMMKQAFTELGELKDNTVEDEANRIKSEITRISKRKRIAYQDKVDGIIDLDMFQEICDEYTEQMAILETKLERLQNADDEYYATADLILELPEMLNRTWIQAPYAIKKLTLNFATSNLKIKDGKANVQLVSVLSDLLDLSTRSEWRGSPSILRTVIAKHSFTIKEIYRALTA